MQEPPRCWPYFTTSKPATEQWGCWGPAGNPRDAQPGSWGRKSQQRGFPGSPACRTPCCHCRGTGSTPGQGSKTPQNVRHSQKVN